MASHLEPAAPDAAAGRRPANGGVLVIADQCGPHNSGMGVYALEVGRRVAARLRRQGWRVGVAMHTDAAELRDAVRDVGASVVPLGRRGAGVGRRMYETVVGLPTRAADYGCYLSLDHKLPLKALAHGTRVITVHDTCPWDCPDERGILRRAYFRRVLPRSVRGADRVVTVSDFAARRIEAVLGVPRGRLVVAPNGFDCASYRAAPAAAAEDDAALRRYGLPSRYFLFVGRVSPRKNLGLVVEALKLLRASGLEPTVAMVGPPGWRDEIGWRDIRAAGLERHFPRLGYVEPDLMPALYRRSSGLLYPSRCEGFGIPVLEALACRVPAVVAAATSAAEVGGRFAIAIDPDDARALAGVMARLLQEGAPPLDEAALAGWMAAFNWDRTAGIVADAVRSLQHHRSRNAA